MIYQEDWAKAWNATESDDERCLIAKTYREAWKKAVSNEEFPFSKWYDTENEFKDLSSHIIHDGNRECGLLYYAIETKNMNRVWEISNTIIYNIQIIYAIKKAMGIV